MNQVSLTGRLTADPEVHDRGGTQVGRLRLAVQRPRTKDGDDRGRTMPHGVTPAIGSRTSEQHGGGWSNRWASLSVTQR